jgi:hypothetical protein
MQNFIVDFKTFSNNTQKRTREDFYRQGKEVKIYLPKLSPYSMQKVLANNFVV